MHRTGCAIAISFFVFLIACREEVSAQQEASIKGVTLKMQEIAGDGEFDVVPDGRLWYVDVTSTLRLSFDVPTTPEHVEISPEWQTLSNVLEKLYEVGNRYKDLSKRANDLIVINAPHDAEFTDEVDIVSKEALSILRALVNPSSGVAILTRKELNNLMLNRRDDPYSALTEILNEKRNELHERAALLAEDAQSYEVIVRAYLMPKGGQRQALHIPGYDNLPQGDYQISNPQGLLPSEEETKRLIGELEAAKKVSLSINNIRRNGTSLKDNIEKLADELKKGVENLEKELRSEFINNLPNDWEQILDDSFLKQIPKIKTPNDESAALHGELVAIREDIETCKKLISLILEIHSQKISIISNFEEVPISEIANAFTTIRSLFNESKIFIDRISLWKDRTSIIKNTFPVVTKNATEEEVKTKIDRFASNLTSTLEKSYKRLGEVIPGTQAILETFLTLKDSNILDGSKGMMSLGSSEPEYIPRPLEELTTAELDLRNTRILVGDEVLFTVDIQPIFADESNNRLKPPAVKYKIRATKAGWHRRYAGNVIFSRTIKGPASKDFDSNIGVSLEWHHFNRENPNSFLNKMDFGIGFHAAFLDHDEDENIEMGGGINISIIDGLLRVGYGGNISSDKNHDYWFFSFGLFSALEMMRKIDFDSTPFFR